MKNYNLLIEKIDNGIKYLQEQSKKLDPVICYLEKQLIERKEELDAKDIFDFYIRLQELKVNSLLVECKMKEILDYQD